MTSSQKESDSELKNIFGEVEPDFTQLEIKAENVVGEFSLYDPDIGKS